MNAGLGPQEIVIILNNDFNQYYLATIFKLLKDQSNKIIFE